MVRMKLCRSSASHSAIGRWRLFKDLFLTASPNKSESVLLTVTRAGVNTAEELLEASEMRLSTIYTFHLI